MLDTTPDDAPTNATTRWEEAWPHFMIHTLTWFITPVRSSPAPKIITAISEITAFDAKPLNS